MKYAHKVRIEAHQNGLREVLHPTKQWGVIYTHLLTKSGLYYQLEKPMSEFDMEFSARVQNCLLVVIPAETEFPFGDSVFQQTARVISYYNPATEQQHPSCPGLPFDLFHTGAWIQTQNASYGLLSIKSEEVTTGPKGSV